ncbi:MAG: ATP-dependent Clp protease proteolytic subunit [Bdellovibrionaceae bacterium]|nr:ATP-dependent Clp protease proteolytic subunit [Pseudobdellovibrionaceae bacterium]|tara:strand:- start:395 stop:970 length:576 start_codon:yes stop_codon:yes gene_type:complete
METPKFYNPIDETLFESRIIHLNGGVNSEMAYRVNRELFALEKKDAKAPIVIMVNSPGGEITSGFSIFDTVRFIEPEVITVVAGLAASMGSIISLAPRKKENRMAFPNSKFLIHQPLIPGGIRGSASELEIHAKDILRTKEKINRLYVEETGKSLEEISKATERDYWMTAQEALEFNLIKKVVQSRSDLKI